MGVMAAVFPIASGVTQCHAFHPIVISIHIFLLFIGLPRPRVQWLGTRDIA